MEWMEILFERGLKHSNPQVRMFVMNRLLMVLPLSEEDCIDYEEDEPKEPEPEPYYFGYDRNLNKRYDFHSGDGSESEDSDEYLEKAKLYYSLFPPPDQAGSGRVRSSSWEERKKVRLIPADTREEMLRFAWKKREDSYHNYRHKVNMFVMSPAFLLHTLLPCLNNNALFKGDLYGIGYLLTSYLIHYPCCVPEFWTDMLTIIASTITNPYALQFLLGSFHENALPPRPYGYEANGDPYDLEPRYCIDTYISWAMHYNRVNYLTSAREGGDVIVRVMASVKANVSRKSLQEKLLRALLRVAFTMVSIISDKKMELGEYDDEWISRADIYAYACIFNEIPYSVIYGMVEPVMAYLAGCILTLTETPYKKKDYVNMSPSLAAWVMTVTAMCMRDTFEAFLGLYTHYLGEENIQKSCMLMMELLKVKNVVPTIDEGAISCGYNPEWVGNVLKGYMKRYTNLLIDEIKDEDLPVFYCYFFFTPSFEFKKYVRSILTFLWHRNAKIDPMPSSKNYPDPCEYTHILSPFSLHLLKVMSTLNRTLLFPHVTIEYLLKTMEVITSADLGLERPVLLQAIRDCSHLIATIAVSCSE